MMLGKHQKLFCKEPTVLGLAEVMDIFAVIGGRKDILKKLNEIGDCPKDGHAPLLSGPDLNAYAAAGIGSDHEFTVMMRPLKRCGLVCMSWSARVNLPRRCAAS